MDDRRRARRTGLCPVSRLQTFSADDASAAIVDTHDPAAIARELATIGVIFERWPTRDHAGDVLNAYAPEIERLKARGGYRAVDVMAVSPDHPDRAALRTKFLSEHTHGEDEVRFFVAGAGLFTLHAAGCVFNILCGEGDLIAVPAGMAHWFDMGAAPSFTVIRMFVNPDGWIAAFTGSAIADRFPRYGAA
jgi:1,2-dihydroxy-3-keto-5-methylthiopentene dioxygenase